jgi:hypothetical protein
MALKAPTLAAFEGAGLVRRMSFREIDGTVTASESALVIFDSVDRIDWMHRLGRPPEA